MKKQYIERLDKLIKMIPDILNQIDENEFCLKPFPDKWSKNEILGHLIDSTANNHQRFIRAQYDVRNNKLSFHCAYQTSIRNNKTYS